MNWHKLKDNKCPKCLKDFTVGLRTFMVTRQESFLMMEHKCGFKISEQKYKEMVSNTIGRELEQKGDCECGACYSHE